MPQPAPALILKFDDQSTPEAAEVVRQLSHELRQPLSTLESVAYYLQMVLPPEADRCREHVEKIPNLVERMNWILSDALHYFRAVPQDQQVVDLQELVSQAVAERNSCEPPHFRFECHGKPALVRLDGGQGRHLLRSLIASLPNLAPQIDTIVIRLRSEGSEVNLEFFLPGVDLSACPPQELFEPFNPRLPSGSGLALATARRIVEAHGGRISAKSEIGIGMSLEGAFPKAG